MKTRLDIGKALRILRGARNISMLELARRSGYDKSMLSRIEGGTRTPSLQTLEKLAEALEVDLWVLVLFASPEEDWNALDGKLRPILDRVATHTLLEAA